MKVSLGPLPLAIPLPAFLVASYDTDGKPNAMTAAWGGVLCAEPPCLGVAVRQSRWTHAGILKHGAFTVNIPKAGQAKEADFLGMYSGKNRDKLAQASLTPVKSELVDAPYIEECPVQVECKLEKTVELGSHTLFVGQVMDVKANAHVLTGGEIDVSKVDPLIYGPNNLYYQLGPFVAKAFSVGKALK
ncbi:MAG: flavin reductase family protein [Deltaproteobacteria bacterium]|jgi:flavin reductase (DIM6/NTAB) family NADH-FMN oxidoreductase RutF|nr:flavin reductase family protein [Deltaproteobacteria bacterium]